jgi:4-amino-4-deoxy-L-arabinose transferase-like glycosyltransferase
MRRGAVHGLGAAEWALILGAALSLRVAVGFGWLRAMPMVSDARDYFELGAQLASGDKVGAFYWPPGESLVLAAGFAVLGPTVWAARAVTIATSVATVALVVLVAAELAGRQAARAAGWIAALYAPSVLLCGQTYAQHVAALALVALAYFGLRAIRENAVWLYAAAGGALGLGCLARPSAISVIPVFAVASVATRAAPGARQRRLLGAVCAAGIALACVVPVLVHDARAGAGWTLSTNNERNLFLGNNPYTPDYKTSHLGQRSMDDLAPDARAYLASFYARPDARAAMQREAFRYMATHPARTALRTANRTTSFWGFDYLASREIQSWLGLSASATLPLLAIEAGSYLVVAVLALLALTALPRAGDRGWRFWLLALSLAYEAPYALAFSGGTYHFPVTPLLIPLAAVAFVHGKVVWRRLLAWRAPQIALAALVLIEAQYAYYAILMRS